MVLGNLGSLRAAQGRMDEARQCFDGSLRILREMGDRLALAKVLSDQGVIEVQDGNADAARSALIEAESIATELSVGPESEVAGKIETLRRSLAESLE